PASRFVAAQEPAVVGATSRLVVATAQMASASLRGRAQIATGIDASEVSLRVIRMLDGKQGLIGERWLRIEFKEEDLS
ncbi:MAG: hypothetical protein ACOVS5_02205, partial [Oligoflexus sp.]